MIDETLTEDHRQYNKTKVLIEGIEKQASGTKDKSILLHHVGVAGISEYCNRDFL